MLDDLRQHLPDGAAEVSYWTAASHRQPPPPRPRHPSAHLPHLRLPGLRTRRAVQWATSVMSRRHLAAASDGVMGLSGLVRSRDNTASRWHSCFLVSRGVGHAEQA